MAILRLQTAKSKANASTTVPWPVAVSAWTIWRRDFVGFVGVGIFSSGVCLVGALGVGGRTGWLIANGMGLLTCAAIAGRVLSMRRGASMPWRRSWRRAAARAGCLGLSGAVIIAAIVLTAIGLATGSVLLSALMPGYDPDIVFVAAAGVFSGIVLCFPCYLLIPASVVSNDRFPMLLKGTLRLARGRLGHVWALGLWWAIVQVGLVVTLDVAHVYGTLRHAITALKVTILDTYLAVALATAYDALAAERGQMSEDVLEDIFS